MPKTRLFLLFAPLVVLACGKGDKDAEREGEFTAEWIGSDTGGLSVIPKAVSCPSDTIIRIVAKKGETGIGLAILPVSMVKAGPYPAFDPLIDSARLRPGVTVATRWVDDKTVAAYQSDSGSLTISEEPTGLAGTFGFRLRGVNTSDTVRMTGHFGGVKPGPCPYGESPARTPGQ